MPSASLTESPMLRRSLLAVAMAGVFLVCLGLAWVYTFAQQTLHGQDLEAVDLGRVTIALPSDWPQIDPGRRAEAMDGTTRLLQDPDRPDRVLLIAPIHSSAPMPTHSVRDEAMDRLLSGGERRTLHPLPMGIPPRAYPLPMAEYAGASHPARGHPILHLVVAFSLSEHEHWIIYLRDELRPEEDPRSVIQQNGLLMRKMQDSITINR